MEFNDSKPIYRQIVDMAYAMILGGEWVPGERVPSVRELSADLGVNTRTVMKAMEELQEGGLISPRRGMGFILAERAADMAREAGRQDFFKQKLPKIREEMKALGITPAELMEHLRQ